MEPTDPTLDPAPPDVPGLVEAPPAAVPGFNDIDPAREGERELEGDEARRAVEAAAQAAADRIRDTEAALTDTEPDPLTGTLAGENQSADSAFAGVSRDDADVAAILEARGDAVPAAEGADVPLREKAARERGGGTARPKPGPCGQCRASGRMNRAGRLVTCDACGGTGTERR